MKGIAATTRSAMYVCIYLYLSIHLYLSIYLSLYLSIYIYIYIYLSVFRCTYVYTYVHTYTGGDLESLLGDAGVGIARERHRCHDPLREEHQRDLSRDQVTSA